MLKNVKRKINIRMLVLFYVYLYCYKKLVINYLKLFIMKKLKDVRISICIESEGKFDEREFIENLLKKHKIDFKYSGIEHCYFYYFISGNKSDIIKFYIEFFENEIDENYIIENWEYFYSEETNELDIEI